VFVFVFVFVFDQMLTDNPALRDGICAKPLRHRDEEDFMGSGC